MVVSPIAGFVIAFAFVMVMMYFFRKTSHSRVNKVFGKLQIASSTFFSLSHGSNDGQKTMGVITALLIAGGLLHKSFAIPIPVIIVAASAISLGTFENNKNDGFPFNRPKTIPRILRRKS